MAENTRINQACDNVRQTLYNQLDTNLRLLWDLRCESELATRRARYGVLESESSSSPEPELNLDMVHKVEELCLDLTRTTLALAEEVTNLMGSRAGCRDSGISVCSCSSEDEHLKEAVQDNEPHSPPPMLMPAESCYMDLLAKAGDAVWASRRKHDGASRVRQAADDTYLTQTEDQREQQPNKD